MRRFSFAAETVVEGLGVALSDGSVSGGVRAISIADCDAEMGWSDRRCFSEDFGG